MYKLKEVDVAGFTDLRITTQLLYLKARIFKLELRIVFSRISATDLSSRLKFMIKTLVLLILLTVAYVGKTQQLKPGFSKQEYIDLLKISAQFADSAYSAAIPPPQGYKLVYKSRSIGLDNSWALWKNEQGTGIISIRGTTGSELSWLANFYSAMVPAKGELQLSRDLLFKYELASNPQATVHVGWLISTGFLVKDILPKVDSCYRNGMREFIITGHSQGGAIVYLLTAYLYELQKQKGLPAAIRLKTYCSAAPKPGNLYFAYEYEALTQEGWAYNVVNSADWVPETPVSIQTINDLNRVNPFKDLKPVIKKQKWPKRWALNYVYGQLNTPRRKAMKRYQKYFGDFVSKSIRKHLDGFVAPQYSNNENYVRTGRTVVLLADDEYYKLYPQDEQKVFVNHLHAPYLFLANKLPLDVY